MQPTDVKAISALELALAHNLVGCLKNAPKNLSTHKIYMAGYGFGSGK
jgi:hypothetical protein